MGTQWPVRNGRRGTKRTGWMGRLGGARIVADGIGTAGANRIGPYWNGRDWPAWTEKHWNERERNAGAFVLFSQGDFQMATKTKPQNRIAGNGVVTKASLATRADREQVVSLRPIEVRSFKVRLRGTTPLVQHRFSDKARESIKGKQAGKAKEKTTRDPDAEYRSACYMFPNSPPIGSKGAHHGVPACTIKRSMVAACRFIDGMPMTRAKGCFFIRQEEAGLVTLHFDSVSMREDAVRLGGPGAPLDLRYRPQFDGWYIDIQIEYLEGVTSPDMLCNLLARAGFSSGLGEMRPSQSGDDFGRFVVEQLD